MSIEAHAFTTSRQIVLAALLALVGTAALAAPAAEKASQRAVESSVVKVFVHSNPPDLFSPWQKAGVQSAIGSGVVVSGNRVLTNAHVVEDAVNIEVKRAGMSEQFVAEVSFVGHDCDLALLEVEDERFFEGARPLGLGDMPEVQDEVQVYGFPIGGETISVTSGIMSRVERSTYAHSREDLLLAQVDAPINKGNSGGPVVAGGSIVGIATQSLKEGENVGYMIPIPVIRHFMEDVADGRYDGFPRLGVEFQVLESEAHRMSLGMDKRETGVLACRIDHGSPAHALIQAGDVLREIDGHRVANDGTVALGSLGRIHLDQVFESKQIGDELALSLLRNGKPVKGKVELRPHRSLVPGRRTEDNPRYLVFGGIVFQPLTLEYLSYFEKIPSDLGNLALRQNVITADRKEVILIQKMLPHPVTRGYHDWEDYVVETVNGLVPRDMEHLAEIVDEAEGPWLEVVTADRSHLTISLADARSAHAAILANFGIARDRWPERRANALTARAAGH